MITVYHGFSGEANKKSRIDVKKAARILFIVHKKQAFFMVLFRI